MVGNFPFFYQSSHTDCGATCLRMIAKFYGKNISQDTLVNYTRTGVEGTTLLDIKRTADLLGFHTEAASLCFADLKKVDRKPCVLHWSGNHFVILISISGSMIRIADPARGIVFIKEHTFLKHWETVFLKEEKLGFALFFSMEGC